MKELERLKVGEFDINNSIKLEDLENNENILNEKIISIEELFKSKNKIVLDKRKLELFLNGVKLTFVKPNDLYKIYNESNNFIGIGIIKDNLLKRDIIV